MAAASADVTTGKTASKTTSRLRCNSTSAGTVGRRQPVRIPPPPSQRCRECRWLRDRPCSVG